ncbi:Fructosamine Ketosamine-3-kinase [Cordyceps militaris]|uniref:protein-ribulosamine 3-kinase n=1 Tax=Cordyceps militaris TaxID=73501 RepID=A0A2H4S668_CORMI|nr:Fructosamine Ketosamine-3-kinase [Cordyceps militaris]
MDSGTTVKNSIPRLEEDTATRSNSAMAAVPPVADLDVSILAALPTGCEVISVTPHGDTHVSDLSTNSPFRAELTDMEWSTGLRIDTRSENGDKSYFVKIIDGEELVGMAEAEYEGQKAIAALIPENSVRPVSWGYMAGTRTRSWFLAEYRRLRAGPPALARLLPVVRRIHEGSADRFGFHVTSFFGPPPMQVGWLDSWEAFWVREFRSVLVFVEARLGGRRDAALQALADELVHKVAPRLLRPLQTGGRSIRPSLCHGDLWDGNIQVDADTGEPVLLVPGPGVRDRVSLRSLLLARDVPQRGGRRNTAHEMAEQGHPAMFETTEAMPVCRVR